jgi:hypothetical protein
MLGALRLEKPLVQHVFASIRMKWFIQLSTEHTLLWCMDPAGTGIRNSHIRQRQNLIRHFQTLKMRHILTFVITLFALTAFGQQMTLEQWNEEAKTNIRLIPKYGHAVKSETQKKSDQEFIETALNQDANNRKVSDHLISSGFQYLYRDIKTGSLPLIVGY